jgi:hypothetical protein
VTITSPDGCESTCQVEVVINPTPICSITGGQIICEGSSTELCASGEGSFLWNTGETTSCISVDSPGVYSVTITSVDGCESTCSFTVSTTPPPVCTITGENTFCEGGQTKLCGPQGATSYLWSNGWSSECIYVTEAGTYTLTVTNAEGCESTCSFTVSTTPPPVCTIGVALSCLENATLLCAPTGEYTYLWNTGETGACITITAGGTYSVTVTNANGCTSTCSIPVSISPGPACIITGNSTFCAGSVNKLCGPPGAFGYLWSTGETSECIDVTEAGSYTLIVTSANGCASDCIVTVEVVTPGTPGAVLGPIAVTPGQFATYSIEPVDGATGYTWTLPEGWTGGTSGLSIDVVTDASNSTDALCVHAIMDGCVGPDACLEISFTTGLDELGGTDWFNIGPNPSHGMFHLIPSGGVSGPIRIMVYDLLGQLVQVPMDVNGSEGVVLHLEDEPSGAYFLRAERGSESRVVELMIQR